MNLNFSIFNKVFASPIARMIGGIVGLIILALQAYHLSSVESGDQLIAVFIFTKEQSVSWLLVFLFGFICVIASFLVVLKMNSSHRFVDGESFPFAIFIIVALSSFPSIFIRPEMLFASFLGVLIVSLLLNIYNQKSITGIIFQSSILCSIAALFYVPSIIFLLIILIGVSIFRPFNIRNLLLICVGFILLYIYLFGLSFIFDWELNLPLNFKFDFFETFEALVRTSKLGVWAIFLIIIISIGRVYALRQKLIVRQRNQLSLLFFAIVLCFIASLMHKLTGSFLFLFSISGIFFLFFYNSINKKWLVEVPLIALLIYNSFISIFN